MGFRRVLVPAAALLLTLACEQKKPAEAPAAAAPQGGAATAKIRFGHVGSMTGQEATFGDSTDKGIKLAIEELNAKGGLKGKQVDLKTYDDQGKPEEAAVAATRLITQDKVSVLLGEVASSRSLAMAPIADANKVPHITPSSTNPKVTKDGDKTRPYVFRVCFIDPFQGTVMAKFATEKGVKKVAILRDVGNAYSVGLADYFLAKFKELGGTIVNDQSYKAGDQDFKAQLTAIKAKGPEAIYVPGYYTDVALIARQAKELGMKVPLMGGDGWDSAKLFEIGGQAIEGSYFSNHYSPDDPSPRIQDFIAALQGPLRRRARLDGRHRLRRRHGRRRRHQPGEGRDRRGHRRRHRRHQGLPRRHRRHHPRRRPQRREAGGRPRGEGRQGGLGRDGVAGRAGAGVPGPRVEAREVGGRAPGSWTWTWTWTSTSSSTSTSTSSWTRTRSRTRTKTRTTSRSPVPNAG